MTNAVEEYNQVELDKFKNDARVFNSLYSTFKTIILCRPGEEPTLFQTFIKWRNQQ
jgi:hypothetical protein